MRIDLVTLRVFATVLSTFVAVESASAQLVFYNWVGPLPEGNWNNLNNWDDNGNTFVPDVEEAAGESARFPNGGTAVIDLPYAPFEPRTPRIAELDLANGTVRIEDNGELQVVVSGSGMGNASIGGAGTLNLIDSGQFSAAGNLSNAGTIRLTGPNTGIQVSGNMTSTFGEIGANITDPNDHGLINVTGTATIGGTLRVNVSGFQPSFGQSWDVLTAGTLIGGFNNTIVESAPILGRGLQFRGTSSGNTAAVEVDNTLVLTVNRQSGATAIHNVVGDPINITSYAVRSANGFLNPDPGSWNQLSVSGQAGSGWVDGNPTMNAISEFNLEGFHSVVLNDTLTLGNPYTGATANASQEDLVFQYSTATGEFRTGIVEYTGIPNDLTLFVDPSDGSAAIGNLSANITPPHLTGYAIRSASGQITTAGWDTFQSTGEAGSGWESSPADENFLVESNIEGSTEFAYRDLISIGEIFTPDGIRDLTFQYTTVGGQLLNGTVQYGEIPTPPEGVPGDYNGDGFVNAADYVFWRDANGATGVPAGTGADGNGDTNVTQADYDFWRQRFGGSAGSGSGAVNANVPEPASWIMAMCGVLAAVACRRLHLV